MANTQFLAVDKLDFFSLKENLKTYLKGQSAFKDYNFDGPNIGVLLDLLAYNTYQNAFYLNMAGNESFLDSAILRDSVASRAKALNYLPRSYTSASAQIRVSLNVTNNEVSSVSIPVGTKFTGQKDSLTYVFTTAETVVVRKDANSQFIANNVTIYEGLPVTEYFIANSSVTSQRFILSNSRVDTDSIKVNVQASQMDSTNTDYTFAESLYGITSNSTVFFLQSAEGSRYELVFGDNVFSKATVDGNVIRAMYRVASGNTVNGITSFSSVGAIAGYVANVSTLSLAGGGGAEETIGSIKLGAPRHFQAQERTISSGDYKSLLLNHFADLKDVGVYGGEDVTSSPQYGRIFIAPTSTSGVPLSVLRKKEIESFLKDRMTLGMHPIIIVPDYMYILPTVSVTYNPSLTQNTVNEIESEVTGVIVTFNDDNLGVFDASFRYSKFVRAIDDADDAIVSNDTSIKMYKIIVPPLNTSTSYSLEFGNEIAASEPTSVISSTAFTYLNRTAFFAESAGQLYVYEISTSGTNILASNIGSIDREKGIVTISDLVVGDYIGDGIKIIVVPKNKDVKSHLHNLLLIDTANVLLTINSDT